MRSGWNWAWWVGKWKIHSVVWTGGLVLWTVYALGFPCTAMAQSQAERGADLRVWTVVETRRVLREELPGELRPVNLAAARREWESFQVLLRADRPVPGISISLSELAGPHGATIGRENVRIFRQHYLHITEGTYRNDQFVPGWYPDPLIPAEHPLTRQPLTGGKYVAMPFDLPAGETHGFFVDVYVPEGTPAGTFRGSVNVRQQEQVLAQVPVELEVWDFELPRVSTLKTAFGSPAGRLRDYYRQRAEEGIEPEPADWALVERQCAELVSRHRINAVPPGAWLRPVEKPDGTFTFPAERIAALKEFMANYHVNAIQIPHPRSVVKDPEQEKARLVAWLKAFDELAAALEDPNLIFYTYLRDEPNDPEAYEYVRQWGRVIRQAKSVVKVLVVEQPQPQDPKWGDLYGAVDIWCPLFCLFEEEPARARLQLGETIWTYTALCQGRLKSPWWHIDYPLLHYRVPAWISWRFGITGLLYWGGMSYWRQVSDPWVESWTYGRRETGRGLVYHGEGTLVYPARPVGYDGIVCSLRLKALRDSIEDYEYLAILERLGKREEALKIVLPLATSWFEWEPDPGKYLEARAQLARLIITSRSSRN
ncbi:MAG: DUF4091 domain-containing protein [Thermoguttaceae bacterium]|nr:DUF4091 domain-containing protein [Thermoguttaceae bacterium]MDW8079947.1 DUF4091 domain-containing protein [Thermoguttaceae bacterium]